jgi:hypothetical protein
MNLGSFSHFCALFPCIVPSIDAFCIFIFIIFIIYLLFIYLFIYYLFYYFVFFFILFYFYYYYFYYYFSLLGILLLSLSGRYTRFLAIAFHGFEKFIDTSNGDFDDEGWKSTSIPEYTSFRTDLVGMSPSHSLPFSGLIHFLIPLSCLIFLLLFLFIFFFYFIQFFIHFYFILFYLFIFSPFVFRVPYCADR